MPMSNFILMSRFWPNNRDWIEYALKKLLCLREGTHFSITYGGVRYNTEFLELSLREDIAAETTEVLSKIRDEISMQGVIIHTLKIGAKFMQREQEAHIKELREEVAKLISMLKEADLPLQNKLQFEAYYEDLFERSLDVTKNNENNDSQTYLTKFLNRNKYKYK